MTVDPVARAYATIGLRPGASARELKERYRKLTKTWHPDRWANDPVSQAEAAQRMRAINDAYATLHRLQTAPTSSRVEAPAAPQAAEHRSPPPRPLTDEELDAIVGAIGSDSWVSRVLRVLAWSLPMVAAFVEIQPTRQPDLVVVPPTRRGVIMGAALFAAGVAILAHQKLTKRRGA